MGFFHLNSLFELIDVLVFLGQEVEVSLEVSVNDQDSFVVMGDSPEPDRGPPIVGLVVQVQEPEVEFQLGMISSTRV